jgi:hypothetical protein
MSFISSKTKIGLAVIVLNLLAGSQYAQAATCKANISGIGKSQNSFISAQIAGKTDWRAKVMSTHGLRFALWVNASNRTINCTKSGKVRTCVMSANPCF